MNKKLIKTIASVACGIGIVSSIPFVSSCKSSPSQNYVSVKLAQGCDRELSGEGDFVDYIIDEPVSPGYHNREHNGHDVSQFEPQSVIGQDFKYTADSMRPYFVNNFWPESEGIYTGDDKVPYTQEFPTYGFYYDKANDQWHFMFKLAKAIPWDFNIKFSISVGVPQSSNPDDKEFYVTNSETLYFYPSDDSKTKSIEVGNLTSVTYKFNTDFFANENHTTPAKIATDLKAKMDNITTGPTTKTYRGWADWLTQEIINSSNPEINKYRSNILSYLFVMEQYCFFEELSDPSKFSYEETPLNISDYRTSTRHTDGLHYWSMGDSLTQEIADTINGTIHISFSKNNDDPSTSEKDITFSVVNSFTSNDSFFGDTPIDGLIYWKGASLNNSPIEWRVMANAATISKGMGSQIRCIGADGDPQANFFIIDIENFDTAFPDGGREDTFGSFNYITHWCINKQGIIDLLQPLFPNLNIDVTE